MKQTKTVRLARGALIAALYAALTYLSGLMGLAIGPFEFRFAEALCILPIFCSDAVWGLTVGCLLGNFLVHAAVPDLIFGSLATLLGAVGTRLLRNRGYWAYLPPVFFNTLIVPFLIYYVYGFQDAALPLLFLSIGGGELLSVCLPGYFLQKGLRPYTSLFS